jgi:two-component system, cell cycle sensor histidine kinase and response regulator CckA
LVMNLAINAADAMPDGGKLSMKTKNIVLDDDFCQSHRGAKAGLNVMLTVSDAGRGMAQETLQRIFDPFFTTKTRDFRKGTGLGLSVVQGIVEQHGGHITCESKPGHGTVFKVYFPVPAPSKRWQKLVHKSVRAASQGTVLLVDDEESVRDIGRRILERSGYSVLTAGNGKDALDLYKIEQANISLVILDLIMPEMGGRQCLDELLKINPMVRVVVATGFSPDAGTQEELAIAARGVVRKPYNLRDFIKTVQDALG